MYIVPTVCALHTLQSVVWHSNAARDQRVRDVATKVEPGWPIEAALATGTLQVANRLTLWPPTGHLGNTSLVEQTLILSTFAIFLSLQLCVFIFFYYIHKDSQCSYDFTTEDIEKLNNLS